MGWWGLVGGLGLVGLATGLAIVAVVGLVGGGFAIWAVPL